MASDSTVPVSLRMGASPARLATRLTLPPTEPSGAMPLSMADGPLYTSMRSAISVEPRIIGAIPANPLKYTSFKLPTEKPRSRNDSWMPRVCATYTEASVLPMTLPMSLA